MTKFAHQTLLSTIGNDLQNFRSMFWW